MINTYLTYLEEQPNELYLYHYTLASMKSIKRHGLLSIYGLYQKDPNEYKKAIDNYMPRIKAKLGDKDEYSIEEIERFFKLRGLDIRGIFCSFWEMIPGLHNGRDNFVKKATLIRLSVNKLKTTWKYKLINANKVTDITYNDIKTYCNKDTLPYQKKKGGKFLFTNIPHLCIIPNDGIIPKTNLEI